MPADATDLTCGYFFNNNNNKHNLNNHKHNNIKAGLSSNSNGNRATSNENQLASVTNSSAHETGNTTSNNSKTSNNIDSKDQKVRISMELYKAKPQYLNTYKTAGHTHTASSAGSSSSASSPGSACSSSGSSQSAKWQPATAVAGELHQWCKIRKMGAGLYNLGNNCYLNATLQCMAYTPSLSQWLVGRPHSPVCKVRPTKGFCTLCEVEKIIYDMFNSGGSEYAKPNSLCFNIKKVSNVFGVGTQEDASEFFTTLLESMTKAIKFPPNAPAYPSPAQTQGSNILDQIFSFQFRSRITCGTCGRLSDTFETTNSWPVDVKYITDIRKGMMHFLREEVLDGENSYRCDACQRKVRATKKYSMQTAPNVLVVNLKRFDFTYAGKLSHFVTYPETLSLKTFVQDFGTGSDCPLRNVSYKLYGVLVHLGYTSHSGHYYSYVRGPNDVWYKADDTQVSTVRVQDALDQNAYILFYNRVDSSDTHPPSSAFLPPPEPVVVDYTPSPIPTPLQSSSVALATTSSTVDSSTLNSNKHIPQGAEPLENKFKATFVPATTTTTTMAASKHHNESTTGSSSSSNSKTLNYDQVLKIKKMNKRKLKLLTSKQKLKDLKRQKKSMSSGDKDEARRKLKKRIKRAKKAVKRQKAKIKKLRKYESCSESDSEAATDDDNLSSAESDWVEAAKVDKRKLHQDDFDQVQPNSKKPKMSATSNITKATTTTNNSLSLLQQYSSASSAASSSDEYESLSSTRSSRSSSRSSSTASNTGSKQADPKQLTSSHNDVQQQPVSSQAPATHTLYSSQNSSERMPESCPSESSSSSSKAAEAEAGKSSLRENDLQTTSKIANEAKWEEASASYNRCSEDLYNKSSSYKTNSTPDFNTNNTSTNRNYQYNKHHNNRSKHHYSQNWKSYCNNNSSSDYSSGYKQHNYNKGFNYNYNYNRYRLNNNNNYSRPKSGSNYSRY